MVLSPRTGSAQAGLAYRTATRTTSVQSIYPKLLSSGFASEITPVFNASVPVMKITDKLTGIETDLSGARDQGMKATEAVAKWLQTSDSEMIRMLFFVVKTFLMIRRCGSTYTGRINSYVLVWMVVAWVHLEWPKTRGRKTDVPPRSTPEESLSSLFDGLSLHSAPASTHSSKSPRQPNPNSRSTAQDAASNVTSEYAEALKGFLSFYRGQFNYRNDAIFIEPHPGYKPKPYVYYSRYYPTATQRFLLSIVDPADASVDMGSKAYGINHIKASFGEAYLTINNNLPMVNGQGGPLSIMLGGDFTRFVEKRARMTRC